MVTGTCQSCGKQFGIPRADRVFRCKNCGGRVAAEVAASKPVDATMSEGSCPSCGAPSDPSAAFCEECGHSLSGDPAGTPAGDPHEQRLLGSELRRAFQRVQSVRWVFWFNAVLYALAFVSLLLASDDDTLATALTVTYGLLSVTLVVGAFQVLSRPFAWSVVIAPIATLTAILSLNLWTILGAVGAWLALGSAASARKLLAKIDGPIRISQKYIAVDGHIERIRGQQIRPGRTTSRVRDQQKARRAKARKSLIIYAAGTVVALVLIIVLIIQLSKPPELRPSADAFAKAWNATSGSTRQVAEELGGFFQADSQAKMARSILRRFERYGWESGRPRLSEPEIRKASEERAWAEFKLPGVSEKLETSWGLMNGEWRLRAIRYPKGLADSDDQ
ncbi:MAG: zinc ribbon domain-containing protein [Planctomycetota bacterium]